MSDRSISATWSTRTAVEVRRAAIVVGTSRRASDWLPMCVLGGRARNDIRCRLGSVKNSTAPPVDSAGRVAHQGHLRRVQGSRRRRRKRPTDACRQAVAGLADVRRELAVLNRGPTECDGQQS